MRLLACALQWQGGAGSAGPAVELAAGVPHELSTDALVLVLKYGLDIARIRLVCRAFRDAAAELWQKEVAKAEERAKIVAEHEAEMKAHRDWIAGMKEQFARFEEAQAARAREAQAARARKAQAARAREAQAARARGPIVLKIKNPGFVDTEEYATASGRTTTRRAAAPPKKHKERLKLGVATAEADLDRVRDGQKIRMRRSMGCGMMNDAVAATLPNARKEEDYGPTAVSWK